MSYRAMIETDGSVAYWSVYRQVWKTAAAVAIPARELAAMNAEDRANILKLTNTQTRQRGLLTGGDNDGQAKVEE